jgi:hypothetical protein
LASQKLELDIRVNADTGQLEVVGTKLQSLGDKAGKTGSAFGDLGGAAGSLFKSFLPFASAGAVLAFFTNAVKGAEEQNEAFRRLKTSIEQTGGSWEVSRQQVQRWTNAIAEATRFSDGDAISALEKFVRVTGSVTQAQHASQLAMGLSVSSGKDLGESIALVTDLLNGNERALIQARREFGNVVGGAKTTQEALDALSRKYDEAALKSEGLTDSTAKLRNSFDQFKDQLGNAIIPVITPVIDFLTAAIQKFNQFAGVLSAFGAAWKNALIGNFKGAKEAYDEMVLAFAKAEDEKTQKTVTSSDERLTVTKAALDKQKAEEEQAQRDRLQKYDEQNNRLVALEDDLNQRIAALTIPAGERQRQMLAAEVQMRKDKINKELKDEQMKQIALAKLRDYEQKSEEILRKNEVLLKLNTSLQIADVAVQTLQTLNSLGEKGSAAERMRAKALLALQQSIAIGWAWVNAMKVGGPLATGLAVATTGLIVAQFAQGTRQIDDAAARESAGIEGININAPVTGIDPGQFPGGGPGSAPADGGGGFQVSSAGGGGGGGGGGQTIINVGGINANFDIEELSLENVDAVMVRIYEALRRSTVESVQLAVMMNNVATKNSNLAV